MEANQGLRRKCAPRTGARKLTEDALAERAEIATRNLQKIEAGEINILLTTAFRIQLGLRCPWKRLMPSE
jgi:transcriptional regulator with XRE-family HTH domain